MISLIVQHGYLAYDINGQNFGIAFSNEKLNGEKLRAFCYMGNMDQIQVLPGEIASFY